MCISPFMLASNTHHLYHPVPHAPTHHTVTTFCFSVTTFEAVEEEGVARVRIQRTGSPKEAACITMETKNVTAVGQ